MTEEIKARPRQVGARQTGNEVRQATDITGGLPTSRDEKKQMISWADLLDEAVKKPGFIHEAYSRFHNYSLGNQLLALFQCLEHGIQPRPLATFPKQKELGRHVKKDEKALTLCIPVTCKRRKSAPSTKGQSPLSLSECSPPRQAGFHRRIQRGELWSG